MKYNTHSDSFGVDGDGVRLSSCFVQTSPLFPLSFSFLKVEAGNYLLLGCCCFLFLIYTYKKYMYKYTLISFSNSQKI